MRWPGHRKFLEDKGILPLSSGFRQLLEEFFLLTGEFFRDFDDEADVEVAFATGLQSLDAEAGKTEESVWLGPGTDLDGNVFF